MTDRESGYSTHVLVDMLKGTLGRKRKIFGCGTCKVKEEGAYFYTLK